MIFILLIIFLSSCSKKLSENREYISKYNEYHQNQSVYKFKLILKTLFYMQGSVIYADDNRIVRYKNSKNHIIIYDNDKISKYNINCSKYISSTICKDKILIHNNIDKLMIINKDQNIEIFSIENIRGHILLHNNIIYFYNNGIYAYDLLQNKIKWSQKDIETYFKDKIFLSIKQNKLYCISDKKITLDINSGKIVNLEFDHDIIYDNASGYTDDIIQKSSMLKINQNEYYMHSIYLPIKYKNMICSIMQGKFIVFKDDNIMSFKIRKSIYHVPYIIRNDILYFAAKDTIYAFDGNNLYSNKLYFNITHMQQNKNVILISNNNRTYIYESPFDRLT